MVTKKLKVLQLNYFIRIAAGSWAWALTSPLIYYYVTSLPLYNIRPVCNIAPGKALSLPTLRCPSAQNQAVAGEAVQVELCNERRDPETEFGIVNDN